MKNSFTKKMIVYIVILFLTLLVFFVLHQFDINASKFYLLPIIETYIYAIYIIKDFNIYKNQKFKDIYVFVLMISLSTTLLSLIKESSLINFVSSKEFNFYLNQAFVIVMSSIISIIFSKIFYRSSDNK